MKKILITLALVLSATYGFSQNAVGNGSSQLNLGLGFSDVGIPFYIGFDRGVSRDITLGAELSYRGYNEKWNSDRYYHNIIGISGNANYHFNRILGIAPQWDLYAGANVGFYVWASPNNYNGNRSSRLGLGGQLGLRYFFSNTTAINLEFGGGNAFTSGKIGLTFKL